MAKFLGIDTGGTFTDFILFDDELLSIRIHKVLSTPLAPERAILQGIDELGVDTEYLTIVHGSTVATNAILEGKGVRTVYITNNGLADVLSIGRQAREQLYQLTPIKKPPLINTSLCVEVASRLSAQGEHLQQLTAQDLSALVQKITVLAPQAVAINLLFSFFDSSEELKIEQALLEQFAADKLFISRSSDVLPEYKEFERGMTTALNAKVGPLMQGYLLRLQQALGERCKKTFALAIMQSSAGTTSAEQAGRYPVKLLLSGPAGGLIGAQVVAGFSAVDRLLSFDMGGTSTDVSIIDKAISYTSEGKIAGYPVAVSMVDMHTIGAGGGSIAQLDAGGLLLVGPQSAGADPGPACYGKGGLSATVTDANVVLGRLLPQVFLGGQIQLDKTAAFTAISGIAEALSMSVEQAAQGIIDVVNDHMVRALRVMSVQRGEDPKEFTLVSFGGAGGLHVCALAEELEMTKALVPVNAGVLSALGMLAADASSERSRTVNQCLQYCDAAVLQQVFDDLLVQATDELNITVDAASDRNETYAHKPEVTIERTIDVRYQGQSNTINLPWITLQQVVPNFHHKHEAIYGHQLAMDIELVNVRVRAVLQGKPFVLPVWQATENSKQKKITLANINKPVLLINRAGLQVSQRIKGPALITETSSTTWLAEGWSAEVDKVGNLLFTME